MGRLSLGSCAGPVVLCLAARGNYFSGSALPPACQHRAPFACVSLDSCSIACSMGNVEPVLFALLLSSAAGAELPLGLDLTLCSFDEQRPVKQKEEKKKRKKGIQMIVCVGEHTAPKA